LLFGSRIQFTPRYYTFIITGTLSLFATILLVEIVIVTPYAEAKVNAFYAFFTKWGSLGSGNGQFNYPQKLDVDPSTHEVFVTDSHNHRIQQFKLATPCPAGTSQVVPGVCFITKWGSQGQGNGQFHSPNGIAIDPSTHELYIVDSENNRIQKFHLGPCKVGQIQVAPGVCFVTKWGSYGSAKGQFDSWLYGVAVDSSTHEVYVSDHHRVQKFKFANPCPTGTTQIVSGVCHVKTWGSNGIGNGQFGGILDVGVDSTTHEVYVSDLNERIQKFMLVTPCPTGTTQIVSGVCFITKWGSVGSGTGQFSWPIGIDVDSSTHEVYVADLENHRIQKFKMASPCPSGTSEVVSGVCFVTKWGSQGTANGQFNLPHDVAIDSSPHRVLVTDYGNHRIQVFVWMIVIPTTPNQTPP
jgi:tripartite motif-containing protein 71